MSWRPVRLHAEDEDAFDAQMLLCSIEDRLLKGSGASYSFVDTKARGEPSFSLRLTLDGGRDHSTILVPLYEGWPLSGSRTRSLVSDLLSDPSDVPEVPLSEIVEAACRVADLCVDPLATWDQETEAAVLEERCEAALNVCAALCAGADPRLDAYRSRHDHFDVDRSDDYDGAVTTLLLDPEMAGDDRTVEDLVDPSVLAKVLAMDPFHVALTSLGRNSRTWRIGAVGPKDGITVSSADCGAMDILRRLHALA
jgi:hypothetical protein